MISVVGAAISIIFVATKDMFCHDKNTCLSQKYTCHDKTCVLTKLCLLQHIFVVTKVLLRQTRVCHDKHSYIMRKKFCCDK